MNCMIPKQIDTGRYGSSPETHFFAYLLRDAPRLTSTSKEIWHYQNRRYVYLLPGETRLSLGICRSPLECELSTVSDQPFFFY